MLLVSEGQVLSVSINSRSAVLISIDLSDTWDVSLIFTQWVSNAQAMKISIYSRLTAKPNFAEFSEAVRVASGSSMVKFQSYRQGTWFFLIYNGNDEAVNFAIRIDLTGKIIADLSRYN